MKTAAQAGGGIGLLGGLFLIFLVLKLTDVIDWSWWWVFAPLYPAAFFAGLAFLALCVVGVAKLIEWWNKK